MLKAKTYHFVKQEVLYGRRRLFLTDILRIECLGGDGIMENKELVFIKPEDVPRLLRGASGKNWGKLFEQIPKGEVLVMTEKDYGSAPNIRVQVKTYNETKKAKVLTVTQRTDSETKEATVYVQRVK